MYLVELQPGKRDIYSTPLAFTDAIRRGEVSADARIYHRASSMWIPVTLHPLFRKFAGEPAEPELPPLRKQWTFLRAKESEAQPEATAAAGSGQAQPANGAKSNGSKGGNGTNGAKTTPTSKNWRTLFHWGKHGGA